MSTIKMDIQVGDWPFAWQLAYRDVVKVNPQYAITEILKAISEAVDGQDDVPTGLLNIDPRWILGFVWMAERVHRPGLKFANLLEEYTQPDTYENLIVAIQKVLLDALDEAAAELEEEEKNEHPLEEENEDEQDLKTVDQMIPSSPPSIIDSESAKSLDGDSQTY